jgi:hypothetical protein
MALDVRRRSALEFAGLELLENLIHGSGRTGIDGDTPRIQSGECLGADVARDDRLCL